MVHMNIETIANPFNNNFRKKLKVISDILLLGYSGLQLRALFSVFNKNSNRRSKTFGSYYLLKFLGIYVVRSS